MHHIFVSENFVDVENSKITIDKNSDMENFNHLVKVLRINVGEDILCSAVPFTYKYDYKCKVCEISETFASFDIIEKTIANELPVKINLYQGLPKSDKLEFIIEKAVELGAYSITPFLSTYCVAKMEKKATDKIKRLQKIARSAAEQSKRNIIPVINEPIDYGTLMKCCIDKKSILFYENAAGLDKTKEYIRSINENDEINIIIGTEGGFSDKEIVMAKENGIKILSLGDRILRTETAAITAMSILMYELQKH